MTSDRDVSRRGVLRRCPTNPRYFTDDSGAPIFMCGSHTWAVINDQYPAGSPRSFDYEAFLTLLEDYGHNYLRVWQWQNFGAAPWSQEPLIYEPSPWLRTGPGEARDGLPKFDLTRFNPAYFERLRARVLAAARRGIYTQVMLFEGFGIKWSEDGVRDVWAHHPCHPDNHIDAVVEATRRDTGRAGDDGGAAGAGWGFFSLAHPRLHAIQEAYVRQVIDCLNDIDSVLWEIANEVPETREALEWELYMLGFVQTYEAGLPKQHPVGISDWGGSDQTAELIAAPGD